MAPSHDSLGILRVQEAAQAGGTTEGHGPFIQGPIWPTPNTAKLNKRCLNIHHTMHLLGSTRSKAAF